MDEIYIIFAFSIIIFLALIFMLAGRKPVRINRKVSKEKKRAKPIEEKPEPKKPQIYETFNYLGTKIYNNDGLYTVVEKDKSKNYSSIETLPIKYRKMIVDLDKQKYNSNPNNYYLENLNGKYYVRFPNGKRKTFKKYEDIPDKIKKMLVEI